MGTESKSDNSCLEAPPSPGHDPEETTNPVKDTEDNKPIHNSNDPRNWSSTKKHLILLIISLSAFLGDFQAPIPCISLQATEWSLSPGVILYATNLNVLMVGIGGILWIPFTYCWGRAPVLFWSTVLGTVFNIVAACSERFEVYYAARAITGLALSAGSTVGLAFIQDMFHPHEWARKTGMWYASFTAAPYLGPMIGNFIVEGLGEWRPVFWLIVGLCGLDLVLILCFLDETWFRRDVPSSERPAERGRLARVVGIWQIRRCKNYFLPVGQSFGRLFAVLIKPVVVLCMLNHAMSFMWLVGINITSSLLFATSVDAGGYGYSTKRIGFLYFTPVVAIYLGQAFGHFFNDWVADRHNRTHSGVFQPEVRLWVNYIGAVLMAPGLVLVGQALEKRLTIGAVVVGWGMSVFGAMIAGVGFTAYLLDCYPNGSGEVSSLLNIARTIGGFSLGYFQTQWGAKVGYGASFGTQAALVGASVSILVVLQVFGAPMRRKGRPLRL